MSYLDCKKYVVVLSDLFLITQQSQQIWDASYRRRTTWSLPEIISVCITIMHSYVSIQSTSYEDWSPVMV